MCGSDELSNTRHYEVVSTLRQIERLLVASVKHGDIDKTVAISATQPYILDYAERKHIYILSNTSISLTVEDLCTVFVPANTWTHIAFVEGMRLFAPSLSTPGTFLVRATDYKQPVIPNSGAYVGQAVTPYGQNPTQTASGAADTLFKWGTNGSQQVSHVAIQNNTGSSIFYAFDQSTTVSTSQVYTLVNGGVIFWDRSVTALHFSSAAQQSFGGSAGITVEGFL